MKKLLLALAVPAALCLSLTSFAAQGDCPSAGSFHSNIDLTSAGMVPLKMPNYVEHADKDDPYYDSHTSSCVVLANLGRASDRVAKKGDKARLYMTLTVVPCTLDQHTGKIVRDTVIKDAQALLSKKPADPAAKPIFYGEETQQGHTYEMCTYTGTQNMGPGSTIAELE